MSTAINSGSADAPSAAQNADIEKNTQDKSGPKGLSMDDPLCPRRCFKLLPIFDEQDIQHLKEHKYSGQDNGFAYKYFFSPVATKLVECLPDWIAPNLLTFIGFLHTIVPFFVYFILYKPSLVGEIPQWLCFVQAYAFFTGRMLDEMDGKQARRTGNSSPLGLLFDHGCDCLSTGLQALIALRTAQIGNNLFSAAFIVIGMWTFHFTTLEEYYIGSLILPPCNAVSDGAVGVTLFFIFSGIIGTDFWVKEGLSAEWLGMKDVSYMTIGQTAFGAFIFLILLSLISVLYGTVRSRSQPRETQCEYADCRHLLIQIFGVLLFSGIWFWYGHLGKEPILFVNAQVSEDLSDSHETAIEPHAMYQFIYMLLYCFTIAHMTIWVQLCHVSRQKYIPFTKLTTFVCVSLGVLSIAQYVMETAMDLREPMLYIFGIVVACQWIFIFVAMYEITKALDISVFLTKQTVERARAKKESAAQQAAATQNIDED